MAGKADSAGAPATGVLRRALTPGHAGPVRVLDACRAPGEVVWRGFMAQGAAPDAVDALPLPGTDRVIERREIGGGLMVVAEGRTGRLSIAGAAHDLAPTPSETGLLAGRNVALAFRLAEPAEAVADWVAHHAAGHGLTGALIVNRADPATDPPARFARALSRALRALPAAAGVQVVVVEPGLPLGKPDAPPETHPIAAPDAPGKDRMERPAPDPWLSALGEGVLHELLKWRWLATARAVLTLDVCDLLCPVAPGAPGAFDLCLAARAGVILLAGRRIYPWRVRAGQPARFADHICRQFDARRGIARWGAAPALAGLDHTWRATRVSYARPDPGLVVPFWRAMALRVPGRATSELAPKTSLVEDPALLAMADGFGHKPVRAPVSAPRRGSAAAGRTAIVTTMKNEGPFILEWLAYHRAIGVSDFLIYTNDCTDGTDTMLALLQDKGIVQHRDNPFRQTALKPQHAALQAAESEPVIAAADWAICMDVDEFINIRIGDGRLPGLFAATQAAMPGANMISLTWRLFGNADVAAYEDRFIIGQFDLCAPEVIRKPHQAWGFKTLFRTIDLYKKLGVHRPKGLRPDLWEEVRWLNGSGRPMPRTMFRNGWRSTLETYGYDWVQLNHYALRSAESFLVKRDRGRVNHVDRDQGLNYWFRMNHNAVAERSVMRMIPALQAEFDRLLADPDIRAAHATAVAAHRAKIAELIAVPANRRFFDELTGERMRRLSRRLHHFGSAVFSAGPAVIPDEIALAPALPPDFFFTVEHRGEAEH
jgi:hypothetical protein